MTLPLTLDPRGGPVYVQIADAVKQMVARGELPPGTRLPTVRALADQLGVNANTIGRVYRDLERDGVLVSRIGRGTFVAAHPPAQSLHSERLERLRSIAARAALEALSLGYTPEALRDAVDAQLTSLTSSRRSTLPTSLSAIRIVGSHDRALDLLAALVAARAPGVRVELTPVGSLGGLIALARDEADVAGCHLLDAETGRYNLDYVRRLLPGQPAVLIRLAGRHQGLIVTPGNPKAIRGVDDLARPGVRFVNRQSGSGTRVRLDQELRVRGITPESIDGYEQTVPTHDAVAAAVASLAADVGLGLSAAASAFALDFVPLFVEEYDLVVSHATFESGRLSPVVETLRTPEFRLAATALGGYDCSASGEVTFVEPALRKAKSASAYFVAEE